ncbi:unnamed protein product, partial [Urochloa humidicola]
CFEFPSAASPFPLHTTPLEPLLSVGIGTAAVTRQALPHLSRKHVMMAFCYALRGRKMTRAQPAASSA